MCHAETFHSVTQMMLLHPTDRNLKWRTSPLSLHLSPSLAGWSITVDDECMKSCMWQLKRLHRLCITTAQWAISSIHLAALHTGAVLETTMIHIVSRELLSSCAICQVACCLFLFGAASVHTGHCYWFLFTQLNYQSTRYRYLFHHWQQAHLCYIWFIELFFRCHFVEVMSYQTGWAMKQVKKFM